MKKFHLNLMFPDSNTLSAMFQANLFRVVELPISS